jgi:hypothetical protein
LGGLFLERNLTRIKVALASVCFAVIARFSIDKPRAEPPKADTELKAAYSWAAFFLAILAGVRGESKALPT